MEQQGIDRRETSDHNRACERRSVSQKQRAIKQQRQAETCCPTCWIKAPCGWRATIEEKKGGKRRWKQDPPVLDNWIHSVLSILIYHIFTVDKTAAVHFLVLFQRKTEATKQRLFIYFVCCYNQLQNVPRICFQDSNRGPWYEICIGLLKREKKKIPVIDTNMCILV